MDSISDDLLKSADAINLMSIKVGYGGQVADDITLDRLRALRKKADIINPSIALEVDGGMKHNNCAKFVRAGADVIIVGTGIYKSNDYKQAVALVKANLTEDGEDSHTRLKTFFAQPSKKNIDDTERRRRLDRMRIELDIPQSSWDPLNSKR